MLNGCKARHKRRLCTSPAQHAQGYAKLCLFVPVLGLHGVQDQCAVLACLASRMCAEPVIGEDSIRCAMLQGVLEQLDLDASTLQTQFSA